MAAAAAQRAEQEVAAIIALLQRQGLASDIPTVVGAAALRRPVESLQIIDALNNSDLQAQARQLLRAVGAGPVSDVASLAHLLRVDGRMHEMEELLDSALDKTQEQSSLISLVNALWVAGLRDEVKRWVHRATSRLPESAIVDLADELRTVGQEETAFPLYAAAAEAVCQRPVHVVAQLCHAMSAAGATDHSERLASVLIDRAGDANSLLEVMVAFLEVHEDRHVDQTLKRAAAILPTTEISPLVVKLRSQNHESVATELCRRAMVTQTAVEILELLEALRDEGWLVTASELLESVVTQVSTTTVFELLATCSEEDQRRILRAAIERPPREVAELLVMLISTGPTTMLALTDLIAVKIGSRTELLTAVMGHLDEPSKEQLFTSIAQRSEGNQIATLLRVLPTEDAKLLVFHVAQIDTATLKSVIDATSADSDGGDRLIRSYLEHPPVAHVANLVNGLNDAHFEALAEIVLGSMVAPELGVKNIARHIAFLFRNGSPNVGRAMLDKALNGRSSTECDYLINALQHQQQPELLAAMGQKFGGQEGDSVDEVLRGIGLNQYANLPEPSRWRRKKR